MDETKNNKRIAKNSLVIYIRLIINIIIGLYTLRLILLALGSNDYGLYSVVGGIVTMMNFVGTSMLSTSYRFIAVEMGKGSKGDLNKIYNTVFVIHALLAFLLLAIGETVGVWYINNYLNVPQNKIPDALFVLHWSLLASAVVVFSYPSNGLIIAREKFVFTSIIQIAQSVVKLVFVLVVYHYIGNRLRLFAMFMMFVNIILPIAYTLYCHIRERKIVKFKLNKNKEDYKKICSYSFWIMLGAISSMLQNQGAAILVNLFFTLAMNAAFGIATQVNGYVQMLVRSIGQATVPQIMKSYSAGDHERTLSLMFIISKYSFFLILIPGVPLVISVNEVLTIWLKRVPEFTNIFILLMLINGMIYTLESGFDSAIQATGKIRLNQIGWSLIGLMTFPIAYVLYKIGSPVYTISLVTIIISIFQLLFHSYILKIQTEFKYSHYLKVTIIPAFKVLILVVPCTILIKYFLELNNIYANLIVRSSVSLLFVAIIIFFLGLNASERKILINVLITLKRKIK